MVREAYSYTPFIFQMRVNSGVAGCHDTNLKLTAMLENSQHKKIKLFFLFMNFKGTFMFFTLGLIMKTIDILPICPVPRRM